MHRLSRALGVLANYVFEHDDIAGLTNGIIRLCGDDQSEGLQVGGDVQLTAAVIAYQYFAKVYRPSLGRDCPQDIGQVLVAESRRLLQIPKLDFDFDVALLALHFGLAVRSRHQIRTCEIQLGGSAAMLVVDSLHATADYVYSEYGSRTEGFDDDGCLRIGLSKCAQTEGDSGC